MNFTIFFMISCSDKDTDIQNIETEIIESENQDPENQDPQDPVQESPDELPNISVDDLGENGLQGEEPSIVGRYMKRLTIPQISNAMKKVSGGIEWGGSSSLWTEYADILGVPDYQNIQEEDRSPSIMFQKFLDDAATYTCQVWIESEISGTSTSLFIHDYDDTDQVSVQENIQNFRRQIQGIPTANSANEQLLLNDYETLFFTVFQRSSSVTESWTTICIAMFTHPDFFYY